MSRRVTENERRHIWTEATCPFCGHELYNGPQGGLMTNVICGNKELCGARFNMGPINIPGFDEVIHESKCAKPEAAVKPLTPVRKIGKIQRVYRKFV